MDTVLPGILQDTVFLGSRVGIVFADTQEDKGSLGNKVDTVFVGNQEGIESQDSTGDTGASEGGMRDTGEICQLVSEWRQVQDWDTQGDS